jgi:hypothetical protein
MPLFPEDLEDVNGDYFVDVRHCSQCPFSYEIIDEYGDYLGNDCEISNCKSRIRESGGIPKNCPLRKKNININVRLLNK